MTGIAKGTILRLLADLGAACAVYLDENVRHLHCKKIQCDEVWAFVYAKDKNLPENLQNSSGLGSVWTWTAICADCCYVTAQVSLSEKSFPAGRAAS